ncbi:MAG: hypothetical protein RIR10_1491 [Planctomycetota bacterium]|jgi:hypothetical protein
MKRFTPNIRHIASTAAIAGVAAMCAVVLSGTSTNRAEAGPPAPSALSIQQKANAPDPQDALDAGRQRLELVDEMRALRTEVAELKALLTSGRVRTNIGNFSDMPLEKIRLEIDYAQLRDAMKGN